MKIILLALGFFAVMQSSLAHAQDVYLDDRSTPKALVRSLYNALNRKEYARAYGYFSTPPADNLEAYKESYTDTHYVELQLGTPSTQDAADGTYYSVPVAIRVLNTVADDQVLAGCYKLRFADPQTQETQFQPLSVVETSLQAVDGDFYEVLPSRCGDGEPPADPLKEEAKEFFRTAFAKTCPVATYPEPTEPESYTIPISSSYDEPDAEKPEVRLFRFHCSVGAYNQAHLYILSNILGELAPVQFSAPELDVRYSEAGKDDVVEDIQIIGYTAQDRLVNSEYDPETLTITSHSKWRGIGDASSTAIWMFRNDTFTLVKYDADASYDGEINPVTILDYNSGP